MVIIPVEREDKERGRDLQWRRRKKKRRKPWWRQRGRRRATCRSLSWLGRWWWRNPTTVVGSRPIWEGMRKRMCDEIFVGAAENWPQSAKERMGVLIVILLSGCGVFLFCTWEISWFKKIEFGFKIRAFASFSSYLILRRPFTSYLVDPTTPRGTLKYI